MSARLITKCPQCERVTCDCIDSTLLADRTEYDGVECQRCKNDKKYAGKTKLSGPYYLNATNARARNTRFFGEFRPLI